MNKQGYVHVHLLDVKSKRRERMLILTLNNHILVIGFNNVDSDKVVLGPTKYVFHESTVYACANKNVFISR